MLQTGTICRAAFSSNVVTADSGSGRRAHGLGYQLWKKEFRSVLVGVSATDPITLLSVALLLALVAAVACFIPAHKATRIDPAIALRPQ